MPLWDLYCEPCDRITRDWFIGHSPADNEIPVCTCGQQMKRLIGQFAVVFTGSVTQKKYLDPKSEDYDKVGDSHGYWQYRKKNTKDGHPEPVFIQTFQDEREYAKSEGLIPPSQLGPIEVNSDGKSVSSRGLPGTW
jgi:hypothetical protein